jgi:aryl-alcohol dehydrogenase-like predicted oxidoreductase
VSSNTSIAGAGEREFTQLSRMLDAARQAASGEHHFRVLELPFNLLEPGALLEKNHANETVLEVAQRQEIAVLVNRPLNAIVGEALIRLADPPDVGEAPAFDAQLAEVARLEEEFRRSLAPGIRSASGGPSAQSFFNWAEQLGQLPAQLESLEQWQEIEGGVIGPRVGQVLSALDRAFGAQPANVWRDWRDRYLPALDGVLRALRRRAADRSRVRSKRLSSVLDPLLPDERRAESLSRKALWALSSTPGVTCVLVGMRQPDYVEDALGMMAWPPAPAPEKLFAAVYQANVYQ